MAKKSNFDVSLDKQEHRHRFVYGQGNVEVICPYCNPRIAVHSTAASLNNCPPVKIDKAAELAQPSRSAAMS